MPLYMPLGKINVTATLINLTIIFFSLAFCFLFCLFWCFYYEFTKISNHKKQKNVEVRSYELTEFYVCVAPLFCILFCLFCLFCCCHSNMGKTMEWATLKFNLLLLCLGITPCPFHIHIFCLMIDERFLFYFILFYFILFYFILFQNHNPPMGTYNYMLLDLTGVPARAGINSPLGFSKIWAIAP